MISEWDIRNAAKKEDSCFSVVDDNIVNKETGNVVCGIKEFLEYIRRKLHCDFELVYSSPLNSIILRCTECGTVIFVSDEDYESDLCCPVCSDYKTQFEYWTGEQIKNDVDKQKTIQFYENMYAEDIAAYKRRKRRGGKFDWEIWKCNFKIPGNKRLYLALECMDLFKTKLKGLRLDIHIGYKDGECSYILKKHFTIPLSWYYMKLMIRIHKENKKNSSK